MEELQLKDKRLTSFRGARIPESEANVLVLIEEQLDRKFTLVDKITENYMMIFAVKNNKINAIGLSSLNLSNHS